MCSVVAKEKDLPLTDEEVEEARALAIGQIVSMLVEGENGRANGADPTGGRNLHFAVKLRQKLREAARRNELADGDAAEVLRQTRPAFREAIHGKLVLPELPMRSEASGAARAAVALAAIDTEETSAAAIEAEVVAREAADDVP